jgi:hypothetical protein
MKRYLPLLAALVLVPSLAFAGWNIRQDGTGTAEWVNGDGDTVPVGRDLTVLLENVSTASTTFVVSPIAGTLSQVESVLFGAIATHDISLTVSVASAGTTAFTPYATDTLDISFSNSAAGDVDTLSLSDQTVEEGGVIAITTSGYSTNDIDATLVIRIEAQ